ncbi:MAG: CHC2 zinc finger domain-containing protein [Burkholderiaceae bacterium]|nr:CHC2 zinc finger domain-containing protein [Burkholderiaceae bacterium]
MKPWGQRMAVDDLLGRLAKVKRTGDGRWMAACPAHKDKGPSLSVRELPDGRVLLHCFAGCSALEVVRAAGVEMESLFPPRSSFDGERQAAPRERRPWSQADAVRALHQELYTAWVILAEVAAGREVDTFDRAAAGRARRRCAALINEIAEHGR